MLREIARGRDKWATFLLTGFVDLISLFMINLDDARHSPYPSQGNPQGCGG